MFGNVLLLISALATGGPSAAADGLSPGRALAETHCAACHAVGQTGTSPRVEAPPFRTLYQRYPVEMLQEALAEGIFVGHPDMPSFVFQPDEIAALIGYMKSLEPRRRR